MADATGLVTTVAHVIELVSSVDWPPVGGCHIKHKGMSYAVARHWYIGPSDKVDRLSGYQQRKRPLNVTGQA